MRKLIAPAFFIFALATGYWVSVESWNGAVYVYIGEQRSPASNRSMRDYSALDRKALSKSIHKQLLASAKVTERNGFMGVTLGHPLFKRAKGTGEFACPVQGRAGVFDRVELTFVGIGVSDSGEAPLMLVEAECHHCGRGCEFRGRPIRRTAHRRDPVVADRRGFREIVRHIRHVGRGQPDALRNHLARDQRVRDVARRHARQRRA